jgi:hypothetical protein
MGSGLRLTTLVVMLSGLVVACSGSDDEEASKAIGAECTSDSGCASGVCAPAGVCSKSCDMHSDCGCSAGTTNGDIADGFCDFGCSNGMCAAVCDSDLDCAGGTECQGGGVWASCE